MTARTRSGPTTEQVGWLLVSQQETIKRQTWTIRWLMVVVLGLWFLLGISGCAAEQPRSGPITNPSHNAAGGYIPACGELPGLVGDDC